MHATTAQSTTTPAANATGSTTLVVAFLVTLVAVASLAIPMYVIRPFRPQDPSQLALALTVRNLAPWVSAVCAIVTLFVLFSIWKKSGILLRSGFTLLAVVTVAAACAAHVNIFEIMFKPYLKPDFASTGAVKVDPDDKVLAVQIGTVAHAYPIRTMGYHHIVNDSVGDQPIAVTYCTLCHTGLVWSRILASPDSASKTLTFRLAGINNGNALMRDEQTGSIWQQSTGQAIFGPLKGQQLTLVHSDELTFALWSKENPTGLVLLPDSPYESEYETKNWEEHIEKTKTVIDTTKSGIGPHELMLGVTVNGSSKAYPVKTILATKVIEDNWDAAPILILVGPDKASIRTFRSELPSQELTFLQPPPETADRNAVAIDQETQSIWDFRGCAIQGKLTGQCLKPLDANKDYWFDWLNHHPKTAVFKN